MANFQGTDLVDVLVVGQFPLPGQTKDGQPLNTFITITSQDLAGNDNIVLLAGNDTAEGGAGDDTIEGGAGDDSINGGEGNDSITLGEGNDIGLGAVGNDTLIGGLGTNNLNGGDGIDYVSYLAVTPASGATNVTVTLGVTGTTTGTSGVDNLTAVENVIGAPGIPNFITGDGNNNILIGGAANDQLTSGGGKDTLEAGLGDDFYSIERTTSGGSTLKDAGGNSDFLTLTPFGTTLILTGPSTSGIGLERQGKNLAIDLDVSGNIDLSKDLLIVDFYADEVSKTAGTGLIETVGNLTGTDIVNSNIPNTANTPGGNVSWTTPTANINEPGDLNAPAPNGGNTIFVDQGVVSYVFTNTNDNVFVPTTATGAYIQGLNGTDVIVGAAGADNINGNLGNDQILGAGGNDGDRTVMIPANTIRVALRGGKGSDNLDGQDGDDLLNGNLDNDTVFGGVGNDIIRGGKGADVLDGGIGDDYLIGDADKDKLTGGPGADTFVLPGSAVAAPTTDQADLITDFTVGTDRFMLPESTVFAQLTLAPISLQIDGGTPIVSTSIQIGTTVYGLVQGVTPAQFSPANFVAADPNILILG